MIMGRRDGRSYFGWGGQGGALRKQIIRQTPNICMKLQKMSIAGRGTSKCKGPGAGWSRVSCESAVWGGRERVADGAGHRKKGQHLMASQGSCTVLMG